MSRARRKLLVRRAGLALSLLTTACGEPDAPPMPRPGATAKVAAAATRDGATPTALDAPSAELPARPVVPFAVIPQPPWFEEARARSTFAALKGTEGRVTWDPLAIMALKPDYRSDFPYDEHPDGKIFFNANNMGFREDAPTQVEKAGTRILVLGDSQTEGVVNNDESFANVLEGLLAARGTPAEVINAGVGATVPQNYLGMLVRCSSLKPDVVIAVIYTGNDFAGARQMQDMLLGLPDRLLNREELFELTRRWPRLLPQTFTQAFIYHDNPEGAAEAVAATAEVCEEMARQCEALGARFVVATLPTRTDLDFDDEEQVAEVLEAFDMVRDDLQVNVQMGDRLRQQLAAAGIETLDLLPALAGVPGPHFWRQDYHLNITGNAAVAGALLEALGPDATRAPGAR